MTPHGSGGSAPHTNRADARVVLERAAALVERSWCQGYVARDDGGGPVPARSELACAWCALGALERATGELGLDFTAYAAAEDLLVSVLGLEENDADADHVVGIWNDWPHRTQDEVVVALKAAAASAADVSAGETL